MLLKRSGFFVLFFKQVLVQRVERRSSKKLENLDGSFKMPAKRLILGQVLYLSPDQIIFLLWPLIHFFPLLFQLGFSLLVYPLLFSWDFVFVFVFHLLWFVRFACFLKLLRTHRPFLSPPGLLHPHDQEA